MASQSLSIFGAARGFLAALWRAIRQLFHEIMGTLFLVVALSAVQSAWRIWRNGAANWLIALVAAYSALMAIFGIWSFRDARRIVIRPDRTR